PSAVADGADHGAGDHRPADGRRLLHQHHRVRVAEHQHGGQPDRAVPSRRTPEEHRRRLGAAAVARADVLHVLLPDPHPAGEQGGDSMTVLERPAVAEVSAPVRRRVPPWRNPWRRPYVLASITWVYILWSLVPVLIAIQFSFNDGRSRSTWQGFSLQWYCCNEGSVVEDPSMFHSLGNSLILGVSTVIVATPLGVALAMGLTRWRSRTSAVANGISMVPLVTPEIVVGSALYLVFVNLYQAIPLGRPAMLLGHVTFTVSYVLVIVRS